MTRVDEGYHERCLDTADQLRADLAASEKRCDGLEHDNSNTLSTASALIASLFDSIKHGDDKHQAWLRGAIDLHFRVCRCGHPEFEHGGPQVDCGHELDGDFCGCVHFTTAPIPVRGTAPQGETK